MSGVWPTPAQELVLAACCAPEPEARKALDLLPAGRADEALDSAVAGLGPLLYRRSPSADHPAVAAGKRAYLSLWRQNYERLGHLSSVLTVFRSSGIECLLLKGAALALRHYRDLGVRGMRDFDLLIAERDLKPAIARLKEAGYAAENGYSAADIERRARVGHAWQFTTRDGQTCDLHWRPLVRCYSPEVTRMFRQGAERIPLGNISAWVPAPTDQLFHVCAHGLQWDWHPQLRWVADAMTVLREPIDWDRLCTLAAQSCMGFRLAHAPALDNAAAKWERREYRLLLKACPLGFLDSARWHAWHFHRIRPFDPVWSAMPRLTGFPQYLGAFLDAASPAELWGKLRPELNARFRTLRGQRRNFSRVRTGVGID
jgi:hypothetical protein